MRRLAFAILMALGLLFVLAASTPRASAGFPRSVSAAAADVITPMVTAIDPSSALNDLNVSVVITGTNFTAALSGTQVLAAPSAYLGSTALEDVTWVNSTTLTATVPWGMNSGVYTLTVSNPNGGSGSLPDAFTVMQGIGTWATGGPYGGSIYTLELGENDHKTLYATVINVGLFRSRTGGASWQLILNGIGWENAVTVDPTDPGRIYMAKRSKGLYRSDDGGDTWTGLPLPIPGTPPYRLRAFVNPHDGALYGALSSGSYDSTCNAGCGLFKYDPASQTWRRLQTTGVLTEATAVTSVGFDPVDSPIIYAGLRDGVVVTSSDGGETWSSLGKTPLPYIARLFVNPIGSHEPWICGTADGQEGGLYKYSGGAWVAVDAAENRVSDLVFDPTAADASTQTLWIAADHGVMQSHDGGQTWSALSPGINGLMAIALNPANPQVIYSGRYGDGVFVTRDGGASWHNSNQGLSGVVPAWLAVNPSDPAFVYASVDSVGIYGSKNGGGSWERLTESWRGPLIVDPGNSQHVIGTSGNQVLIADNGWHFNRSTTIPLPPGMSDESFTPLINALAVRSGLWLMGVGYRDRRLPYMNQDGGGGIYASQDGENWAWVDPGRTLYSVTAVGFDPIDPNVAYAATYGGGSFGGTGAVFFKSADGGQTWQQSTTGLPPRWMCWDTHMAIEPTSPYRIFLSNGGGLHVSADHGATWSDASNPAEFASDTAFNSILFMQGQPAALYAASTIGLFRTMDGAQTWQRAQGAIGQLEIWSMAGATTSDRQTLYTATTGGMASNGMAQLAPTASGTEKLVNAGVYRYTTRLPRQTYLPLMLRSG